MEPKDWILVLTPIVANGVIIFIFQYFITRSIDKKNRIRHERVNQLNDTILLLESFNRKMYDLRYGLRNDSVGTAVGEITPIIHEIKRYFEINKSIIPHQDAQFIVIVDLWNELVVKLQGISTNKNRISPEDNLFIRTKVEDVYDRLSVMILEYKKARLI